MLLFALPLYGGACDRYVCVCLCVCVPPRRTINTYIHSPLTINGPQITQLGLMEIKGAPSRVCVWVSVSVCVRLRVYAFLRVRLRVCGRLRVCVAGCVRTIPRRNPRACVCVRRQW